MNHHSDPIFREFCGALNAELAALGCKLHISEQDPGTDETMLLLAADGRELGWLPDHSDALVIAALEKILAAARQSYVAQ